MTIDQVVVRLEGQKPTSLYDGQDSQKRTQVEIHFVLAKLLLLSVQLQHQTGRIAFVRVAFLTQVIHFRFRSVNISGVSTMLHPPITNLLTFSQTFITKPKSIFRKNALFSVTTVLCKTGYLNHKLDGSLLSKQASLVND